MQNLSILGVRARRQRIGLVGIILLINRTECWLLGGRAAHKHLLQQHVLLAEQVHPGLQVLDLVLVVLLGLVVYARARVALCQIWPIPALDPGIHRLDHGDIVQHQTVVLILRLLLHAGEALHPVLVLETLQYLVRVHVPAHQHGEQVLDGIGYRLLLAAAETPRRLLPEHDLALVVHRLPCVKSRSTGYSLLAGAASDHLVVAQNVLQLGCLQGLDAGLQLPLQLLIHLLLAGLTNRELYNNKQPGMQIIDNFYLVTSSIIALSIVSLLYMKIGLQRRETFHVTISGSNVQSFLLAYQLWKLEVPNLNITLVGKFDPEFMKIAQAELNNQIPNVNSLNSQYIDRKIIEFCGNEPMLMGLIQDTHLQFKIKRAEVFFNKGNYGKGSEQSFASETYKIDEERNAMNSIVKYGLSHVTAMSLFSSLQKHLQFGVESSINEDSMRGILNKVLPYPHRPAANGLQYLSQIIGLDQKYIRDYVNPVISSHYLHNVNSVATIFKLLPLYCDNYNANNGRTKNLVLNLNDRMIAAKILWKLKDEKNIDIKNMKLMDFQQGRQKVVLTIGASPMSYKTLTTDLLVILEDFEEENQKQISYYRTIVDGIVASDQKMQQFYTIHFQNSAVLSVTRLCANQCKNYRNNAYLVVSRTKLQEKDLTMFTQHQILNYRKFWGARSQLPSSVIKFKQTPHIYRVSDTELISDNYEMKLVVFRNIANQIKRLAGIFQPQIEVEKQIEYESDSA